MHTYVLKNAIVYDGTGSAPQKCDVAIDKDTIVAIAKNITASAQATADLDGRWLVPGFIDVQNHSDSYWQIFDNPSLDSMLLQGITSVLIGSCGASLAPLLSKDSLLSIQKWHDLKGVNLNWQTFAEYGVELSQKPLGCNIGSLVGYSTLRRGLIGDAIRTLEKNEIAFLKGVIKESMHAGAFGLSTGLSYAHELNISELELFELVQGVAEEQGLFSVHLRNESSEVVEGLAEALEIAENTGARTKISHFKIRGKQNYHLLPDCVALLQNAYHRGVNIHFDLYPYSAVWQPLYSYLPKWVIEGGRAAMLRNFSNPTQRQKILSAFHNLDTNLGEMLVVSSAHKLNVIGKKISEIAKGLSLSHEETALKLIENGGSELLVFDRCVDEKQLEDLLMHPLSIVATDGAGFPLESNHGKLSAIDYLNNRLNHPRCYGTTARFLSHMLQKKLLSPEEAIRKMTGAPARVAGFARRGEIKVGNFADLVILNPEQIKDMSEYVNPAQGPKGIEAVFVNGTLAVENSTTTGNLTGYFLKKG